MRLAPLFRSPRRAARPRAVQPVAAASRPSPRRAPRRLALAAFVALLAAVAARTARADELVAVPDGYNLETLPALGGQVVRRLAGGTLLLKSGGFGPNVLRTRAPDGTLSTVTPAFDSFAGATVAPGGDLVVGNFGPVLLWRGRDGNGDGDVLDAGEWAPHPASLAILPPASPGDPPGVVLPYDLAFAPGTDDLYLSGSQGATTYVVRIAAASSAAPVATIWYETSGFAGGLAFHRGALHLAVFGLFPEPNRVVRLVDVSGDGDALDAGESGTYASGLSGANFLAFARDGTAWVSGTFDPADFSASVTRLAPDADHDGDADAVDPVWLDGFHVSGFDYTGLLVLDEGPAGMAPGVAGDGLLYVANSEIPEGAYAVRTAPFAQTAVSGTVANDSAFHVTVTGAPAATALHVLSLDQTPTTIPGVGDLCLGFGAPHLVSPPVALDGTGRHTTPYALHGAAGLVGLGLTVQGLVLQSGEIGIANALDFVIQP